MLALEALFRFQSKEIKDQVLYNYSIGVQRHGFVDKENDQEKERMNNGAYDENIIFGDEQVVFDAADDEADDEEAQVAEKDQWT